jgi:hypothetical protein
MLGTDCPIKVARERSNEKDIRVAFNILVETTSSFVRIEDAD